MHNTPHLKQPTLSSGTEKKPGEMSWNAGECPKKTPVKRMAVGGIIESTLSAPLKKEKNTSCQLWDIELKEAEIEEMR